MTSVMTPAIATNPWLTQTVRIEAITPEVAEVSTYHLKFTDPSAQANYQFAAGQFNMLYVPGVGEIAIGVCATPMPEMMPGEMATDAMATGDATWDHTIRLAGQVTGALSRLAVGDTLGLRGPYGTAWPLDQHDGKDVILVAGGTGLASLRAALYSLLANRDRYSSVSLLYGGRTPDTLLYRREYDDWTRRGLRLETTVDRATSSDQTSSWAGHVGVVPQLVDRFGPINVSNAVIYCCGPEVMMRYTIRSAMQRGFQRNQIWVSLERNLQCAVGICGHCQLGGEFICKDGPVFRYDRVEKILSVESF
jgi:NAD(P)H-flavin reductase